MFILVVPQSVVCKDNVFFKFIRERNISLKEAMGEEDYRSLVADYVNYRLDKHGYHWENAPAQRKNNKVYQAVRKLGDEFENKQDSSDFHDMVTSLQITPETAHSTFSTVTNEMFSNGINWGRVVALIGFGGAFSVECVSRNMPQLVDLVVDWVATYMNSNLKDWISKNGGWVSCELRV